MMFKTMRMATVLAAAAGIPYACCNPKISSRVKSVWNEWQNSSVTPSSPAEDSPEALGVFHADERILPVAPSNVALSLAGEPIPLREILRFDVSPRWVTDHWERVSTFRSDDGLEALRVSLVTGTSITAVTGSLTYCFDEHQEVRRITLHGHTGDDRPVTALVTEHFKLRPEPALGAGLYLSRWNGKPTAVLRVSHPPVMRTETPFTKFRIYLELNRPHRGYGLSATGQALVTYNGR